MKAHLKNYRQSPRKVRLVADLVRGKQVGRALAELSFLPKRASDAMVKLIRSAAANAENNFKVSPDELVVREIRVDQGVTLKRWRPRSRGMANRINKRTSNVTVVLGQGMPEVTIKAAPKQEKEAEKPAEKKTEKKAPAKKTSTTSTAKKETK